MMVESGKARVFVSCGQADGTEEIKVAAAVAERLLSLGYDPYVAMEVHSLRALRENIFRQLSDTEYFLFIDLRREPIGTGPDQAPVYRGSVFAHQELAIASFLDVPMLGFQETGVRQLDGLVGAVQANCLAFTERSALPDLVEQQIAKQGWSPRWQNKLVVTLAHPLCARALRLPENVTGRFFHLRVINAHRYTTARNCTAYLRSVTDRKTGAQHPFETVELKWAGYIFPNVSIPPGSWRPLDAFWISENEPTIPRFNSFADSTHFIPGIQGPGDWDLVYEVSSDTVAGAIFPVTLHIGADIDDARLGGIPCSSIQVLQAAVASGTLSGSATTSSTTIVGGPIL